MKKFLKKILDSLSDQVSQEHNSELQEDIDSIITTYDENLWFESLFNLYNTLKKHSALKKYSYQNEETKQQFPSDFKNDFQFFQALNQVKLSKSSQNKIFLLREDQKEYIENNCFYIEAAEVFDKEHKLNQFEKKFPQDCNIYKVIKRAKLTDEEKNNIFSIKNATSDSSDTSFLLKFCDFLKKINKLQFINEYFEANVDWYQFVKKLKFTDEQEEKIDHIYLEEEQNEITPFQSVNKIFIRLKDELTQEQQYIFSKEIFPFYNDDNLEEEELKKEKNKKNVVSKVSRKPNVSSSDKNNEPKKLRERSLREKETSTLNEQQKNKIGMVEKKEKISSTLGGKQPRSQILSLIDKSKKNKLTGKKDKNQTRKLEEHIKVKANKKTLNNIQDFDCFFAKKGKEKSESPKKKLKIKEKIRPVSGGKQPKPQLISFVENSNKARDKRESNQIVSINNNFPTKANNRQQNQNIGLINDISVNNKIDMPNFYFSDSVIKLLLNSIEKKDFLISEEKFLKINKENYKFLVFDVPKNGLCGFYCLGLEGSEAISGLIKKIKMIKKNNKHLKMTEVRDPIVQNVVFDIRNSIYLADMSNKNNEDMIFYQRLIATNKEKFEENQKLLNRILNLRKRKQIDGTEKNDNFNAVKNIYNILIEEIFDDYLSAFKKGIQTNNPVWYLSFYMLSAIAAAHDLEIEIYENERKDESTQKKYQSNLRLTHAYPARLIESTQLLDVERPIPSIPMKPNFEDKSIIRIYYNHQEKHYRIVVPDMNRYEEIQKKAINQEIIFNYLEKNGVDIKKDFQYINAKGQPYSGLFFNNQSPINNRHDVNPECSFFVMTPIWDDTRSYSYSPNLQSSNDSISNFFNSPQTPNSPIENPTTPNFYINTDKQ